MFFVVVVIIFMFRTGAGFFFVCGIPKHVPFDRSSFIFFLFVFLFMIDIRFFVFIVIALGFLLFTM